MRTAWFLPRSTLALVGTGFVLVALPLVAAIVTAVMRIDAQGERSYAAALRANTATRLSRAVDEHLLAMERALGQYDVLGNDELRETYLRRRESMLGALNELDSLELGTDFDSELDRLAQSEASLFALHDQPFVAEKRRLWEEIAARANVVEADARGIAEADIFESAQDALNLQRTLLLQTVAALPISLVLAVVFSALIARPIRQIDEAIRRLGADNFKGPIEIQGPRDLREVGECLDALGRRMLDLERQQLNFVRKISHEVKTPLTTLRQGAELLADPGGTSAAQTVEIGEMMRESSLELQRLIEDLLEFGKTQRITEENPAVSRMNLGTIAEGVLAGHSLTLKSKGIQLEANLRDAFVTGDPRQLRTVTNNLIANAVKFSPRGGRLTVATDVIGGEAVVDVIDTGPGIPVCERQLVFEPFHQGQPMPGAHVKGTGLGLAIAKEYAEAHHGCIEILNPDSGAHFRVRLPGAPPAS
jgi:two-component system sensor histidine kinase GlrK